MGSKRQTPSKPSVIPPTPPASRAAAPAAPRNPVREARQVQRQQRAAEPSADARYAARRPFTYNGVPLDRDQVFGLTGQANDERLVRLGYVAVFGGTPVTCNVCGAPFASAGALQHHGITRHRPADEARLTMAPRQPGESDFDFDRRREAFERSVVSFEEDRDREDEEQINRTRPLNWENTQATREAQL